MFDQFVESRQIDPDDTTWTDAQRAQFEKLIGSPAKAPTQVKLSGFRSGLIQDAPTLAQAIKDGTVQLARLGEYNDKLLMVEYTNSSASDPTVINRTLVSKRVAKSLDIHL